MAHDKRWCTTVHRKSGWNQPKNEAKKRNNRSENRKKTITISVFFFQAIHIHHLHTIWSNLGVFSKQSKVHLKKSTKMSHCCSAVRNTFDGTRYHWREREKNTANTMREKKGKTTTTTIKREMLSLYCKHHMLIFFCLKSIPKNTYHFQWLLYQMQRTKKIEIFQNIRKKSQQQQQANIHTYSIRRACLSLLYAFAYATPS